MRFTLFSDPSEAASLFVGPHLEEKKQKFGYFLMFLKGLGLWGKASATTRATCLSHQDRQHPAIDLNAQNKQLSTEVPVPPELNEAKDYAFRPSRFTTPLSEDDSGISSPIPVSASYRTVRPDFTDTKLRWLWVPWCRQEESATAIQRPQDLP